MISDDGRVLFTSAFWDLTCFSPNRYDAGEDVDGQMNSENPFGGMNGFPPGMEQMLFAQMFSQRGGFGGGPRFGGGGGGGRRGGHSHSYSSGGRYGHSFDFF